MCALCLLVSSSLSRGFSRQEYWSLLPFPSPGDLPNSGIEPASPASPASPAVAERFFSSAAHGKIPIKHFILVFQTENTCNRF